MQGRAGSWPIDNSIVGGARHGVEWRSLARAETISFFAKAAAEPPIGQDTRMKAHWSRAHCSSTIHQVAQPQLFGRYAELSYRRVCDAGASLVPDADDVVSRKKRRRRL
jgi:hypothetical protein